MNDLHFSPAVQDDLSDIKAYIVKDLDNPQAAASVLRGIFKAIRMLQTHALIGTPLSTVTDVDSDYRYLVCGSYMVFYRTSGRDVYIDRVLYGRRDYLRVLFADVWEDESAQ